MMDICANLKQLIDDPDTAAPVREAAQRLSDAMGCNATFSTQDDSGNNVPTPPKKTPGL